MVIIGIGIYLLCGLIVMSAHIVDWWAWHWFCRDFKWYIPIKWFFAGIFWPITVGIMIGEKL